MGTPPPTTGQPPQWQQAPPQQPNWQPPMQPQPQWQPPMTQQPQWPPTPHRPYNWKLIGGAMKMVGLVVAGVGAVVIAYGVGTLSNAYSANTYTATTVPNFLNSIAGGLAIIGAAAMVYGIAKLLESLHREG